MRPRIWFLVADSQRRSTVRRYLIRSLMLAACWAVAPAAIVCAQETINYASVSGRVTDPQGAVVPGAQVSARQTDTNVTLETVTNSEGRFRFPYLKVGPYEVRVHVQGFSDSARSIRLTRLRMNRFCRHRTVSPWPRSPQLLRASSDGALM